MLFVLPTCRRTCQLQQVQLTDFSAEEAKCIELKHPSDIKQGYISYKNNNHLDEVE